MQVTIGQEVACFGSTGHYQGIYTVTAVTPKGTKITVQRNDGHERTFDQNGNETNTMSSKYRRDYIRTDVDAVRHEQEVSRTVRIAASALCSADAPLYPIHRYQTKEELQHSLAKLKERLAEVEQLINLIPEETPVKIKLTPQ